jgi:EmrB/QacA subfamily drug resistance transporter
VLIGCAFFIELLDTTALNTAVPQIALSLHQNPIDLKVALTSYLLSLGVFIPVSGWMADRFGTRNIFGTAMIIFIIGSIFCGLSNSLIMLVVFRIIQGIGGAMMTPVARLIMLRTFAKTELVQVTSKITIVTLIAPTLGPIIGGAISSFLSWRFIFFINIPLGLVGSYCIFKYIKNETAADIKPFDLSGFIILGISLAGFLLGLDAITDPIMPWRFIVITLMFSAALFALFFLYAKNKPNAIINTSIFKARNYTIATLGLSVFRLGTGGVPFILPLMLQLGFGYSPICSGLMVAPMALGMLIMKSQVKPIVKRFGFKKVLVVNAILVSFFLMQLSWIAMGIPSWAVIVLIFIYGIFISLQFSSMNVLLYSQIPEDLVSTGSSIISANQQISTCFGVAVTAIILEYFLDSRDISQYFSAHAFHMTLIIIGGLSFLTSIVYAKLPGNIAENVAKGQA